MAPQSPSIQSFFQPEAPASPALTLATNPPAETGDGFTHEEVESTLKPKLHRWQPRCAYNEVDIGRLEAGPGCVVVVGRVVNMRDEKQSSNMPHAAKGHLKLIIKDDTGALSVKLWYAKVDYQIHLGQLVSIWTPHLSNPDSSLLTLQNASLKTSIFPERDNSCYFSTETSEDETKCRTPPHYKAGEQLPELITLKAFIEGGNDAKAKVLVCIKSIGGRKKFTTKEGNQAENVDVKVFDNTSEATLTLWGCTTSSAIFWKPSHTIILLTNPGFKDDKRATIFLTPSTHVDIDPCMADTIWLRDFARRLTKREHVNPPFPENVFDIDAATTSELRLLFTLADIDEFARAAPTELFMGYLSLTIMELHLVSLHQRHALFSSECCGIPLFANSPTANCKHCSSPIDLKPNPHLIGPLIDETGSLARGALLWSLDAWTQLLGRTAAELGACDAARLDGIERRLLFLRVTVVFGWGGSGNGIGSGNEGAGVGRLVVGRVVSF